VYGNLLNVKGVFKRLILVVILLYTGAVMSEIYENSMSMDESPVELSLGKAKYRVPRNYLYRMSQWSGGPQKYVGIRVTYPGLRPYNTDTAACMLHKTPCRIYEINLHDKFQTLEDSAANLEEIEHPERGVSAPFGFTRFKKGPENARSEVYRKIVNGKPIMFFCLPYDANGKRSAICHRVVRAPTGATLTYFFDVSELHDAIEVDTAIKQLIDRFSIR
jgi:hypothetical protein